jgi:hypothetical protein
VKGAKLGTPAAGGNVTKIGTAGNILSGERKRERERECGDREVKR